MGSKRTGSSLEAECAKKGRAGPEGHREEASTAGRPCVAEGGGGCSGNDDDDDAVRATGGQGVGEEHASHKRDAAGENDGAHDVQAGHGGDGAQEEEDTDAELCGICLEDTALAAQRGFLDACSHVFCFECILRWSEVESRCPMCKQRFTRLRRVPCRVAGAPEGQPARGQRSTTLRVPLRDQRTALEPMDAEAAALAAQDAYANTGCSECGGEQDEHLLLLCDRCDGASHTYCVGLGNTVPEGSWLCRSCRDQEERRRSAGGRLQEIRARVRGRQTRSSSRQLSRAPSGTRLSRSGPAAEGVLSRGRALPAGRRRGVRVGAGPEPEEEEEESDDDSSGEEEGDGEEGSEEEEEEEEDGDGEEDSEEEEEDSEEEEEAEEGEDGEGGPLWEDEVGSGASMASSESELDLEEHRALSTLVPPPRPSRTSASVPARRRRRKRKKGRRRKKRRRSSTGRASARASSAARASQRRRGGVTWGASQQSLLQQLRETARTSLAFRNAGSAGTIRAPRAAPHPRPRAAPALLSPAGEREEDPFAFPLSQLQQAGRAQQSSASGVRTVLSQRVAPNSAPQWPWAATRQGSRALTTPTNSRGATPGPGQASVGRAAAPGQRRVPAGGEDPEVAASWRLAERAIDNAPAALVPGPFPSSLGRSPVSALGAQAVGALGRSLGGRLVAAGTIAGSPNEKPRAQGQAPGPRAYRPSVHVPAVVAELDWGFPTQRPQAGASTGSTLLPGGGGSQAPAATQSRDASPDRKGMPAPGLTTRREGASGPRQDAAAGRGQGVAGGTQEERGQGAAEGGQEEREARTEPGERAQSPHEEFGALPGFSAQVAFIRTEKRRQWERHRGHHSPCAPSHAPAVGRAPAPPPRPPGALPESRTGQGPSVPGALPESQTGQDPSLSGSLPESAASPGTQGRDAGLTGPRGELSLSPRPSGGRRQQQALEHGTDSGSDGPEGRLVSCRNVSNRRRDLEPCSTRPSASRAPALRPDRPGPPASSTAGPPSGPPASSTAGPPSGPPASSAAGPPSGPAEAAEVQERKKHKELVARAVKDRLQVLYRKGDISRDSFKDIARLLTHQFMRELELRTAGGANAWDEATGRGVCARRTQQCLQPRVSTAVRGQVCIDCVESLVAERCVASRLKS